MKKFLELLKKWANRCFIDGLSGMALGLFCTLIVGTILAQIASLIGDNMVGNMLNFVASVAKSLTGAGIGVGVACKLKQQPLVTFSAATAGMVGAFASKIIAGQILSDAGAVVLSGPGEPLGAFVAAYVAIEIGGLVAGKTKVDILVTPIVTITAGSAVGLLVGPPISSLLNQLGALINWGTEREPLLMGIVVSVLMGIALTLPISSAALGIVLGLSGIAGGAAVVGCSAQMVGFAVASFRENKWGGLAAQGVGTSMLQMPNIVRHPQIWLPAIISSAILGPISTMVFQLECNSIGAGMGTSGLVGPIMTFETMTASGTNTWATLGIIVLMEFVAPAVLALGISELMRKFNLIKSGDMALDM